MLVFINISLRDRLVRVDPPVPPKRPVRTITIRRRRIDLDHNRLLPVMSGLVQDRPERIGDERTTPEFHGALLLKTYPVHAHHMHPVGDGMTTLHGLPGIV